LSFGEKLTATLMSFGMIMPTAISLLKDLKAGYAATIGTQIAYNKIINSEILAQ
jgi:hypothetical protein